MSSAQRSRPRRRAAGRARSRKGRTALWVAVALFVVGAVALGISLLLRWRGPVAEATGPRHAIHWPDGVPAGSAAERALLTGLGFPADGARWRWRRLWVNAPLAPGPHWLPESLKSENALDYLARTPRRPRHQVTVPEGWDRFDIAARLEASNICASAAFLAATRDEARLQALSVQGASAEGFLFPATYDLYENTGPNAVVELLVKTARKRIVEAANAEAIPPAERTPEWERHVVTLASLVEKEAAVSAEHRTIAGVFHNRLTDPTFRPRQMLQTDPSAAYGCKLYRATLSSCGPGTAVTPQMLRDAANPYNTYRHPGLPPGPIANPGGSALRAAMKPQKTDYFFFVARGDGTHTFSRTLTEHEGAIHGGK